VDVQQALYQVHELKRGWGHCFKLVYAFQQGWNNGDEQVRRVLVAQAQALEHRHDQFQISWALQEHSEKLRCKRFGHTSEQLVAPRSTNAMEEQHYEASGP
jgi:hypothetical protein